MRGRKPVPTGLRALRGNPSKRPYNAEEPHPDVSEADLPASLVRDAQAVCGTSCGRCAQCRAAMTAAEAIKEWNRHAPQLVALGVLTEWDLSAFEACCRSWGRYITALDKVSQQGEVVVTKTGHPMQNPYLSIANKALAQCQLMWAEFGMMPSARTRIGATPRKRDAVNPLDKYLRHTPR